MGDYWTKSISFECYHNEEHVQLTADPPQVNRTIYPKMRIAACDYYRQSGDSSALTTRHLVIVPDEGLFNAPMNIEDTTAGGYVLSKFRTTYKAGAVNAFNAFFGSSHILPYREYLVNAVTDGRPTGGGWFDCNVKLMDERQVYGSLIFDSGASDGSNDYNRYSVSCKQLPLFKVRPDLISNRQYFWLRNIISTSRFASVNNNGNCDCNNASDVNGVRPAALIH